MGWWRVRQGRALPHAQRPGSPGTSPGTVKRLRRLLDVFPRLLALLASALGWLRASLPWPRRGKPRGQQGQARETQELKVEEEEVEEEVEVEEEGKEEGKGVQEVVPALALQAQAGWLPPLAVRQPPAACQPRPACQPPAEHFEIAVNFVRHLFDTLVVALLWLASPVFRVVLDVLGLRGLLKLWLHGMALFLVVSYGMALALWLMQAYMVQLALLFGAAQLMVLGVSIRQQDKADLEGETRDPEGPVAPSDP